MNTFINTIKNFFNSKKSDAIDTYFSRIDSDMQSIIIKCENIERKLEEEIETLIQEVSLYKGILRATAEALPDMMWCKDLNGKYLYANDAIKNGLLFSHDPIGKNDIELSIAAKAIFGNNNHTFGEDCLNSDLIVLEKVRNRTFKKEDGRFLESGYVKGEMMHLEVFKAPFYIDDVLAGVVGTGRDITEYVKAFENYNNKRKNNDEILEDIFARYRKG